MMRETKIRNDRELIRKQKIYLVKAYAFTTDTFDRML